MRQADTQSNSVREDLRVTLPAFQFGTRMSIAVGAPEDGISDTYVMLCFAVSKDRTSLAEAWGTKMVARA